MIPHQFEPDGSAPREEARTKSLSYSYMNLNGFSQICRMAQLQGVDLWNYETSQGESLKKAINYITPFLLHPSTWKKKQIKPFHMERNELFLFSALGYDNPKFYRIYQSLQSSDDAWAILLDLLAGVKKIEFQ